ncbi:MAG: hypothetical protein ACE5OZ_07245 [Candidatus Heimdallarchaeota archaeon]
MPFYCANPDCWGENRIPNEVSKPGQLCSACQEFIPFVIESRHFITADQFDIVSKLDFPEGGEEIIDFPQGSPANFDYGNDFDAIELDHSLQEEIEPLTSFFSSDSIQIDFLCDPKEGMILTGRGFCEGCFSFSDNLKPLIAAYGAKKFVKWYCDCVSFERAMLVEINRFDSHILLLTYILREALDFGIETMSDMLWKLREKRTISRSNELIEDDSETADSITENGICDIVEGIGIAEK